MILNLIIPNSINHTREQPGAAALSAAITRDREFQETPLSQASHMYGLSSESEGEL
jgi:hypothetical protein